MNSYIKNCHLYVCLIVGDGVRRMKGAWDSIHVFEVQERGRNAHYKLTSTVMLYMITNSQDLGNLNLSGSMTRQVRQKKEIDPIIIENDVISLVCFVNKCYF